jgi:probable blue pigment (indigoidine) exporter
VSSLPLQTNWNRPYETAKQRSATEPPVTAPDRPATTAGIFLLIVLFWGLNYPFVILGLAFASPLWLASLRAGLGAIVLVAYVSWTREWGRLDSKQRRDAILIGVPNTAIFFGLWFVAAQHLAPGLTAVVIYTFPLIVALLSAPVLNQRLTARHWTAVIIGFAGVVLASQVWQVSGSSADLIPIVELLVAAFSWALATVLFQRRFEPATFQEANAFQLIGGTAALLIATLVFAPLPLPHFTVSLLLTVFWLGVLGTGLAYAIWFRLLSHTKAATLSAYTFLVPVVALIVSVTYFHESLSVPQVVGVLLVLASIYGIATARGTSASLPR